MGKRAHQVTERIGKAMHSSRGRNFLVYLLFVVVAYLFWVMLSLDTEVTKDYEVAVAINNLPPTATVIEDSVKIQVSVRAKGVQLLRFNWRKTPEIKVDFNSFSTEDNRIVVPRGRLVSMISDYFGSGVSIVSVKPESLNLTYTTRPGVMVKVRPVAGVSAAPMSVINGQLISSVDSVLVYSVGDIPADLTEILTDSIVRSGLKDSLTIERVRLRPVKGLKFVPNEVGITIPVEPLIAKKQEIPIIVENAPQGTHLLTFPSKIEISYLVPMSFYKKDLAAAAVVDFADTELPGDKIPISLGNMPEEYHNISFSPDSVEYLIEHR